jgi:hypothetical protein
MAIVEADNGVAFDPAHVTLANLSRMGAIEYDAVMEWVSDQRQARATRLAEHETQMAEWRKDHQPKLEATHAANREFAEKHPWL